MNQGGDVNKLKAVIPKSLIILGYFKSSFCLCFKAAHLQSFPPVQEICGISTDMMKQFATHPALAVSFQVLNQRQMLQLSFSRLVSY